MEKKGASRARVLSAIAWSCSICFASFLIIGCGVSPAGKGPGSTQGSTAALPVAAPTGANLGYIWRSSDSTIRAISGVPGSAHIDAPLIPEHKYTNAAASMRSRTIVLEDGDGNLWVFRLGRDQQPKQLLSGVAQKSRIVFAPEGDQVVVFTLGSNSLIQVTGLALSPQATTRSVNGTGMLSAVTPSDDGTLLLASQLQDGSVSIVSAGTDGSVSLVAHVSRFGGMAFLRGKSDALLADGSKNILYSLHLAGANSTLRSIASAHDGLSEPTAVAATLDNRWAAVINHGDGGLIRIDISGQSSAQRVQCTCIPTELTPLAGDSVFQLNSGDSSPIWLVDFASPQPKLSFIPSTLAQSYKSVK